jgi:hypothetical protein
VAQLVRVEPGLGVEQDAGAVVSDQQPGLGEDVPLPEPGLGRGGRAGVDDPHRVVEVTLLMATTAWPCSRPSEAMLGAYASEPAVAAMRLRFTEVMRRTVEVTISGLLARQKEPRSASPRP